MPGPRAMFITDIVVEHLEEVEFLWCQRQSALRSPKLTIREFSELEERIEAHVQGVLAAGDGVGIVAGEGLASDDAPTVFASAYALLRHGSTESVKAVVHAFAMAEGARLEAMCQALCRAGPASALAALRSEEKTPPLTAAAIEMVMAFRQPQEKESKKLDALLEHAEPAVRARAWQAASYRNVPRSGAQYETGLKEPDPAARQEAVQAAAWGKHQGLLTYCRRLATAPVLENFDALMMLAILGKPEDARLLSAAARAPSLGPKRFALLGTFGSAEAVEALLREMRNPNPAVASAAGEAFTMVTGKDVETDRRAPVPPEPGAPVDDFEKEFPQEVALPDVKAAQAHWDQVKGNFAPTARYAAGKPIAGVSPAALPAEMSMQSRWEACLRARFEGQWSGGLADVMALPQRLPGKDA